jgi:hypothetical protein
MAVSVVVAVGDVADPLIAAVKERLPKVKVGPGLEPDSEMGPLITREHRDKVAGYLDTAAEQGATVVADGRELDVEGDGFFLGVSLIDEVTPEMDAYRDEIFGPVLSVTRVGTYDEAVRLVNDNPYGNGTAIFTRDGGVARQFQFDAQAGMVGVNVPIPVPVAYYSFGGWKASLFGDRTSTARRGSTSTRAARSSRRGGPIRPPRRSISDFRRHADHDLRRRPRDGLQNEPEVLGPKVRADLCNRLAAAGLPRVEAVSFVRGDRVPQMEGAEDVVDRLHEHKGTTFAGLVLERAGVRPARRHAARGGPSDARCDRDLQQAKREPDGGRVGRGLPGDCRPRSQGRDPRDRDDLGRVRLPLRGDVDPGRVADLARRLRKADEIVLAGHDRGRDAAGRPGAREANEGRRRPSPRHPRHGPLERARGARGGRNRPRLVDRRSRRLPVRAAVDGNVATEDLVYLLEGEGIDTGIELDALISISRWLEGKLGRELPSRVSSGFLTCDQTVTYSPTWTRCSRPSPTRRGGSCSTSSSARTADADRARGALPMTRFGVMKHLKVLEEAGSVTSEARPREAPLPEPRPDPARPRPVGEQVREPWARRSAAQETIGGRNGSMSGSRCSATPRLRDLHQDDARAPLGGDHRSRDAGEVHVRRRDHSDWTPGSSYTASSRGDRHRAGENLEVDPPRRLVQT